MNKYQIFGLISGQVLMGLLFSFGGVILTALLGTVYEELTGNYIRDLSTHILYSLYGGYFGMQIGIGFDGYKYFLRLRPIVDKSVQFQSMCFDKISILLKQTSKYHGTKLEFRTRLN